MEAATVRVHLFKVCEFDGNNRTFGQMVNEIFRQPLDRRVRRIGNVDIRLDNLVRVRRRGSGRRVWRMDFTRLRDGHGPGKAARNTPVESLEIADTEYFGEETAAVFLPDSGYFLLQYNHFGVRPTVLMDYVSKFLGDEANSYGLDLCLDLEAQRRYQRQHYIRRFEIGIDLAKLTAADRARGDSLSRFAAQTSDMNALRMKVSVSVGTSPNAVIAGARALLENLLTSDAVVSAEVAGRETMEGKTEVVDLIHEKLVYSELVTPGPGRRLTQEDRFGVLNRAIDTWVLRIDG